MRSPTSRRSALRLFVLAAALWPIAHIGLAFGFGMSSWKLGGWGMYATPAPAVYYSVRVQAGEHSDGARGWQALDVEALGLAEHAAPPRVLSARRWLGRLVSADRVAAELLAGVPDAKALRVVIESRNIDPRTGIVSSERERGSARRN